MPMASRLAIHAGVTFSVLLLDDRRVKETTPSSAWRAAWRATTFVITYRTGGLGPAA